MSEQTPITMQKLLETLRALENAGSIPNIVVPGSLAPRRRSLADELATLMDNYDLSSRLAGGESGARRSTSWPAPAMPEYAQTDAGLLISSLAESIWKQAANNVLFGSIGYFMTYGGMSRNMNPFMWPIMDDQTAEAQRRVAEEAERQLAAFDSLIDQAAAAPVALLADPEPARPPAPARSPDYMQTLTGWRGWNVSDGKLESLGMESFWKPRRAIAAQCSVADDDCQAPALDCSCGWWSFKSAELMKKALAGYRNQTLVVGSVELWGRVIECEHGWRSEYAYPRELWLLKPGLEWLSWTYGVPVRMAVPPAAAAESE